MDDPRPVSTAPLVAAVLLGAFFFTGPIFGWGSLQLLLEKEGVFSKLCTETSCSAQQERFSFMYTLGSTAAALGALPSGMLVDSVGPRRVAALNGLLLTLGFLLFAVSPSESELLLLAAALIGFGGMMFYMNSFPLAFVVSHTKLAAVQTAVSCFFDASTVIFLLCLQLYLAGFTRKSLFVGLAVIAAGLHMALVVLWGTHEEEYVRRKSKECDKIEQSGNAEDGEDGEMATLDSEDKVAVASKDRPSLHHLTVRQQLLTFEFVLATCFAVVHMLRSNVYLGTSIISLENLGDSDHTYTQVLGAILPLAPLTIPAIDRCLKGLGLGWTFHIVNLLGMLSGLLSMVLSLELQVLTFVVYTTYRSFLYAVLGTYTAHTFGPRTVGRVHGTMFLIGAMANFLQYPGVTITLEQHDGDLIPLYLALSILCLPVVVVVELLRRRIAAGSAAEDTKATS